MRAYLTGLPTDILTEKKAATFKLLENSLIASLRKWALSGGWHSLWQKGSLQLSVSHIELSLLDK